MNIISIVPRLPPAIDGLGDYALRLACQLQQDFASETHFIVGEPTWSGVTMIEGFGVSCVSDRTTHSLFQLLCKHPCSTVLLHYVGYGYAQRGCPLWLVNALEQWKFNHPNARLVTMFHEVYASGPPWASAFWLSSVQRNLAARLARLSDRCVTSNHAYAEVLHTLSRGKHSYIPALPVFSNIGEPKSVLPLAQRKPQLVIFGGCNNRIRVYQESLAKLNVVCETLGIEEIIDIGSPTKLSLSTISTTPILEMGQQSAAQTSNILSNAYAGFLDYAPDYLAKSGIFAAYCAHGLLPINAQGSSSSIDGIIVGKHYWFPEHQRPHLKNWEEMQAIADSAYAWYQTHPLILQAQVFAQLCLTENLHAGDRS